VFVTVKLSNHAWLIYGNVATKVVGLEIYLATGKVYTILGSLVMADASQFPPNVEHMCWHGGPQSMDEGLYTPEWPFFPVDECC
jgi:hypothetical protein